MSSVRNSCKAPRLILSLLLGAFCAGNALADILVLRADGPSARSFPPGRRLPDNSRLVLKANDQLIVLDSRGTRTIRGPGNFIAGVAPPPRIVSAEPVLQRRARIGAVRGPELNGNRPGSIWEVDVARSGNICVSDPQAVRLWRADAAKPAVLVVTRLADGAKRKLRWEAGAQNLPWPSDFAIADAGRYRFQLGSGDSAPSEITFKSLAALPTGLDGTASILLAKQCSAQLDLFIDTVRTDAG